jgi:hypothetical protein
MDQCVAVVAAVDETETLVPVLAQLRRLHLAEVIVVANGPGGEVARIAGRAGATVLRYEGLVGHDVGRAIGAARAPAGAEALLFVDADLVIPADDLAPFLTAVANGVDVALNRTDPYIHPQARLHPVFTATRFLGCALGRPDLGCASLTAVPHAISRRALDTLGPEVLAVPPKALAQAVHRGLRVEAVHPVDVVRANPPRPGLNEGRSSPVEQLILGDHLEAIDWVLRQTGSPRGGFSDLGRRRELLPT